MPEAVSENSCLLQYADDVFLATAIVHEGDADIYQSALNSIAEWSADNRLTINVAKTKTLQIHKKGAANICIYQIDGLDIENVHTFKYLGVIVDRKYNWRPHIEEAAPRAMQTVNIAARFAKYSHSRQLNSTLYQIYAAPIIEYAVVTKS